MAVIIHGFIISKTFVSNTRLKLAKIKPKLFNILRLNFLKIISFLHPRYHPKIIGHILKSVQKIIVFVLMKMKMKSRSHKYDINRHRPRHGH